MNAADTAWMLVATALVLMMTPALGFFYAGMVRSKNALNTLMMSFAPLGFDCLGGLLGVRCAKALARQRGALDCVFAGVILAVALYMMGGALWYAMGSESSWFEIAATARAVKLALVIAAGTAAYFGSLWIMGLRLADFSRHE